MTKSKRRIKLIKPGLQIRLTMTFVGLAALALILQFLLLMARLSEFSVFLPEDGAILFDRLDSLLLDVLLTSALLFLPLIFAVGILATFRIAGPVYRFERFLEQLVRGEGSGPCRLRKGDHLQELCDLLNRAIETLEKRQSARALEERHLEQPVGGEEKKEASRVRVVA